MRPGRRRYEVQRRWRGMAIKLPPVILAGEPLLEWFSRSAHPSDLSCSRDFLTSGGSCTNKKKQECNFMRTEHRTEGGAYPGDLCGCCRDCHIEGVCCEASPPGPGTCVNGSNCESCCSPSFTHCTNPGIPQDGDGGASCNCPCDQPPGDAYNECSHWIREFTWCPENPLNRADDTQCEPLCAGGGHQGGHRGGFGYMGCGKSYCGWFPCGASGGPGECDNPHPITPCDQDDCWRCPGCEDPSPFPLGSGSSEADGSSYSSYSSYSSEGVSAEYERCSEWPWGTCCLSESCSVVRAPTGAIIPCYLKYSGDVSDRPNAAEDNEPPDFCYSYYQDCEAVGGTFFENHCGCTVAQDINNYKDCISGCSCTECSNCGENYSPGSSDSYPENGCANNWCPNAETCDPKPECGCYGACQYLDDGGKVRCTAPVTQCECRDTYGGLFLGCCTDCQQSEEGGRERGRTITPNSPEGFYTSLSLDENFEHRDSRDPDPWCTIWTDNCGSRSYGPVGHYDCQPRSCPCNPNQCSMIWDDAPCQPCGFAIHSGPNNYAFQSCCPDKFTYGWGDYPWPTPPEERTNNFWECKGADGPSGAENWFSSGGSGLDANGQSLWSSSESDFRSSEGCHHYCEDCGGRGHDMGSACRHKKSRDYGWVCGFATPPSAFTSATARRFQGAPPHEPVEPICKPIGHPDYNCDPCDSSSCCVPAIPLAFSKLDDDWAITGYDNCKCIKKGYQTSDMLKPNPENWLGIYNEDFAKNSIGIWVPEDPLYSEWSNYGYPCYPSVERRLSRRFGPCCNQPFWRPSVGNSGHHNEVLPMGCIYKIDCATGSGSDGCADDCRCSWGNYEDTCNMCDSDHYGHLIGNRCINAGIDGIDSPTAGVGLSGNSAGGVSERCVESAEGTLECPPLTYPLDATPGCYHPDPVDPNGAEGGLYKYTCCIHPGELCFEGYRFHHRGGSGCWQYLGNEEWCPRPPGHPEYGRPIPVGQYRCKTLYHYRVWVRRIYGEEGDSYEQMEPGLQICINPGSGDQGDTHPMLGVPGHNILCTSFSCDDGSQDADAGGGQHHGCTQCDTAPCEPCITLKASTLTNLRALDKIFLKDLSSVDEFYGKANSVTPSPSFNGGLGLHQNTIATDEDTCPDEKAEARRGALSAYIHPLQMECFRTRYCKEIREVLGPYLNWPHNDPVGLMSRLEALGSNQVLGDGVSFTIAALASLMYAIPFTMSFAVTVEGVHGHAFKARRHITTEPRAMFPVPSYAESYGGPYHPLKPGEGPTPGVDSNGYNTAIFSYNSKPHSYMLADNEADPTEPCNTEESSWPFYDCIGPNSEPTYDCPCELDITGPREGWDDSGPTPGGTHTGPPTEELRRSMVQHQKKGESLVWGTPFGASDASCDQASKIGWNDPTTTGVEGAFQQIPAVFIACLLFNICGHCCSDPWGSTGPKCSALEDFGGFGAAAFAGFDPKGSTLSDFIEFLRDNPVPPNPPPTQREIFEAGAGA